MTDEIMKLKIALLENPNKALRDTVFDIAEQYAKWADSPMSADPNVERNKLFDLFDSMGLRCWIIRDQLQREKKS